MLQLAGCVTLCGLSTKVTGRTHYNPELKNDASMASRWRCAAMIP